MQYEAKVFNKALTMTPYFIPNLTSSSKCMHNPSLATVNKWFELGGNILSSCLIFQLRIVIWRTLSSVVTDVFTTWVEATIRVKWGAVYQVSEVLLVYADSSVEPLCNWRLKMEFILNTLDIGQFCSLLVFVCNICIQWEHNRSKYCVKHHDQQEKKAMRQSWLKVLR